MALLTHSYYVQTMYSTKYRQNYHTNVPLYKSEMEQNQQMTKVCDNYQFLNIYQIYIIRPQKENNNQANENKHVVL